MRADESDLLCGRRCPRRGGVVHGETAHGDEVAAGLVRIENGPADIDLHQLLVGIDAFELRPERGVVAFHLAEPQRVFADGFHHVVLCRGFGQPLAVQIDGAGVMLASARLEPIALDLVGEGIEDAEE